jgi:hypothetical protein
MSMNTEFRTRKGEPEVADVNDRGFGPGPRVMVEGTKIGGWKCTEADREILRGLLAAMPARPASLSSLTLSRQHSHLVGGRVLLIGYLDLWAQEDAQQIAETVVRTMTEPFELHVRGRDRIGDPALLWDTRPLPSAEAVRVAREAEARLTSGRTGAHDAA